MILPTKHVSTARSLLGLGAILLSLLERPQTVTALWDRARLLPPLGTFERFTLALDFLNIIGAVGLSDGLLRRCSHDR